MTITERNKRRWADPDQRAKVLAVLAVGRAKPMSEFDKAVWRARLSRTMKQARRKATTQRP